MEEVSEGKQPQRKVDIGMKHLPMTTKRKRKEQFGAALDRAIGITTVEMQCIRCGNHIKELYTLDHARQVESVYICSPCRKPITEDQILELERAGMK